MNPDTPTRATGDGPAARVATAGPLEDVRPVLPYGRQCIEDDDVAAVAEALRGEFLTTGPQVDAFERELAARVGHVPVVALSNGTAALHAAYAAAGLLPGTELVTTPLTFAATATAALHLGARVRFVDVADDTLTLDPATVAAAVGPATRVVTAVDYAGQPADYRGLRRCLGDHPAVLVADAAHSLGASQYGRPVGALADLTTFSFHPVKAITTGEGGAVAVARADLLTGVRSFRSHGMVRDPELLWDTDEGPWHQEVHSLGLNYRLPDVLAALGRSQLRKLDRFVGRRQHLAARYAELLADVDGLRLPQVAPGSASAWHLYPVRVLGGRRREVFNRLRRGGIAAQVHYLPVYRHPLFAELGFRPGSCPVAERAYSQLLSLPLHPGMTDADQDRVVAVLRERL